MIKEIIDLCSRPGPACDFIEDMTSTEAFKDDYYACNNELRINTGDMFGEKYILRFIPEQSISAFFAYIDLKKLYEDFKDRNAEYWKINRLAEEYHDKYNNLVERYNKQGYLDEHCYMLLYRGNENSKPRVYMVKPRTVLNLIERKKLQTV